LHPEGRWKEGQLIGVRGGQDEIFMVEAFRAGAVAARPYNSALEWEKRRCSGGRF
jgi:hypothetical protein